MTVKTKSVSRRLVQSAVSDDRRVHITPRSNGWAVRKEGNLDASEVVSTQTKAVEMAKTWVVAGKATKIIVHSKNGKFRVVK